MGLNARSAIPQTPDSSVNLAAQPVNHCTNATIVKNRLIISNAIDAAYLDFKFNICFRFVFPFSSFIAKFELQGF